MLKKNERREQLHGVCVSTDEEPQTGHQHDQQPAGETAEWPQQPDPFRKKDDSALHPAAVPQLPAWWHSGSSQTREGADQSRHET